MEKLLAIGLIGAGLYLLLKKQPPEDWAIAYPYPDDRDLIVELGDVE